MTSESATTSTSTSTSTPSPVGFYQIAARYPDREAIIDPDGTVLTYGYLGARVNRISHALRALGLGDGDTVAVAVRNGHEFLELVFAVGQVGMFVVPINAGLTGAEIEYLVRDSGARVLVASADAARKLSDEATPEHRFVLDGHVPGWQPYDNLGRGEPDTAPDNRRYGYMMSYTSGTTGRPKGVRNTSIGVDPETVIPFLLEQTVRPYVDPEQPGTHLVCSPLYHAAPPAHAYGCLNVGHKVVIHRKFDAERVLDAIERHRVTTVHMVPTHFHRLLQLPHEVRSRYDVSSLQAVIHAGAPCPVAIKREMLAWLGPVVWEYFAGTEGYVSRVSPREWMERPGTVGKPVPGVQVRIIGEDGVEVPAGEAGIIYFGNPERGTFSYHNDPQKTADSHRDGLGTAGDYGYVDKDGYLFPLDRRVDLIISGGVNVYPAEVEERLLTHPAVADAAVIGVPHPDWGTAVVAVVQPASGAEPDAALAAQLTEHCRQGLASYKCPRHVEFRAEFPRTESGKLQRRVLRDAYRDLVIS